MESRTKRALKSFKVYKLVDGQWVFWMNARGVSAAQLRHTVWWRNKGKVPKERIKVEHETAI